MEGASSIVDAERTHVLGDSPVVEVSSSIDDVSPLVEYVSSQSVSVFDDLTRAERENRLRINGPMIRSIPSTTRSIPPAKN
jgi:hypothetical protein